METQKGQLESCRVESVSDVAGVEPDLACVCVSQQTFCCVRRLCGNQSKATWRGHSQRGWWENYYYYRRLMRPFVTPNMFVYLYTYVGRSGNFALTSEGWWETLCAHIPRSHCWMLSIQKKSNTSMPVMEMVEEHLSLVSLSTVHYTHTERSSNNECPKNIFRQLIITLENPMLSCFYCESAAGPVVVHGPQVSGWEYGQATGLWKHSILVFWASRMPLISYDRKMYSFLWFSWNIITLMWQA